MVMNHTIYFNAAQNMSRLKDNSIDLVVTSPPYPMIEMWDDIMSNQNPDIHSAFDNNMDISNEVKITNNVNTNDVGFIIFIIIYLHMLFQHLY